MKTFNKLCKWFLGSVLAFMDWLARSPWVPFALIFILSFAVRVDELMKIPSRYLVPNSGWELSAIAISLMETGQFANPYMIPTGPTAHLPPVYPAIFSLIYKVFGLTPRAGYVSMLFMLLTTSILYASLPWFAKKLGISSQAGVIGGLAGALFVEWGGHGEYPSAIVLGLFLVAFSQRWTKEKHSSIGSLLLGLGIGASFHLQPALLPVILGCMLFEVWWSKNQSKWRALNFDGAWHSDSLYALGLAKLYNVQLYFLYPQQSRIGTAYGQS